MSKEKGSKGGRLPASAKKDLDVFDIFQEMSLLDVDPRVKEAIEAKGHTIRWINASKFKEAGGFNKHGWQPVRISDLPEAVVKGTNLAYGATAEGFMIRNDMMLASRPQELTNKHEKLLQAKALLASGKTKQAAEGIRDSLGKYGRVIEGYEENGEDGE